jgi:hypothetical protein
LKQSLCGGLAHLSAAPAVRVKLPQRTVSQKEIYCYFGYFVRVNRRGSTSTTWGNKKKLQKEEEIRIVSAVK